MPIRLLLAAALALALLALPAAARAASYVPGEVIVKYRSGTAESTRERPISSRPRAPTAERPLPGGSEQVAIDDGDSVRETVAELRDDPNVAYAVPNYRAHASQRCPTIRACNRSGT